MKLTIHEIAQVVGAKNDISIFEDMCSSNLV
ncbi:UDP-N-acetylmuramoylalanyl-D-glutamyl-2%2C 6-diaminopimelate--D-alanyl-D-alanyl ligase [Streptococcus pneumoniae]|nr:UDP-N-acetylmuramoylalanyl-D-glutamyl-2%2C 6-diaminopimelate--D-alanyl-D-alanyl ligase [Streptococcus pneumoniae]